MCEKTEAQLTKATEKAYEAADELRIFQESVIRGEPRGDYLDRALQLLYEASAAYHKKA